MLDAGTYRNSIHNEPPPPFPLFTRFPHLYHPPSRTACDGQAWQYTGIPAVGLAWIDFVAHTQFGQTPFALFGHVNYGISLLRPISMRTVSVAPPSF